MVSFEEVLIVLARLFPVHCIEVEAGIIVLDGFDRHSGSILDPAAPIQRCQHPGICEPNKVRLKLTTSDQFAVN